MTQKNIFKNSAYMYLFIAGFIALQSTGCTTFFVPTKQKITIQPGSDSTAIYMNNVEVGIGTTTTKVRKWGFTGFVLKTNGYPLQYEALPASRYDNWVVPLCIIDIGFVGLGIIEMLAESRMRLFPKYNEIELLPKLIKREQDEKYIQLEPLKIDVYSHTNQFQKFKFTKTLAENISKSDAIAKENLKKSLSKKNQPKPLSKFHEDIPRSKILYKSLNENGFIDTVNNVFLDNNNTIVIEPMVTKRISYYFSGFKSPGLGISKEKVYTKWYIKNTFGEKLDSVSLETMSGTFVDNLVNNLTENVTNQYLQDFLNSDTYKEYAKQDTNFNIQDAPLIINKPKNIVVEANDATLASVIIKRKDQGHGSGFAISNDGYILTNYHVIAGEYANKQAEFTVILSNGEEVKAQVVRYNKMRDVALLKVDATFEKAFNLQSEKTYKRLMNVYTVGTPKSIELGQSVSLGILSNERKANNNNLLQLNMSVNSGNSGGPLFDKQGNLHGIVTSKLVGFSTEGVSFAIPSYVVADYLNIKL